MANVVIRPSNGVTYGEIHTVTTEEESEGITFQLRGITRNKVAAIVINDTQGTVCDVTYPTDSDEYGTFSVAAADLTAGDQLSVIAAPRVDAENL